IVPAARAAAAAVEHLQLAAIALQHHLGRIALLPRLVLPLPRLQLPLDIDLGALLQLLLRHLREVLVEDDDGMPLRLLLALAGVLVAPALRRSDPKIDDRIAGREPLDIGI